MLGLCRCMQAFFSCDKREVLSSCGAQVSYCSHFSCCREGAPRQAGSAVVVQELSCSVACEIFLDQGLNQCLLHWQAGSLPLSHRGSLRVRFDLQFIHPVFLRSVFLAFVLNLYIALVSTLIFSPHGIYFGCFGYTK